MTKTKYFKLFSKHISLAMCLWHFFRARGSLLGVFSEHTHPHIHTLLQKHCYLRLFKQEHTHNPTYI